MSRSSGDQTVRSSSSWCVFDSLVTDRELTNARGQTSASKILLYALELLPSSTTVYELPRQVKNAFASGPGEGRPIPGLILRSAGELHVDRTETISW